MATEEFYRDEHPKPGGGGSWGGGGGGGGTGGGGWISGGGGGGAGGGGGGGGVPPWVPPPAEDAPWFLIGSWNDEGDQLIIVDANGTALTNGLELLMGPCCMRIEIECQIKGNHAEHVDCILLGAVAKEGEVSGNAIFEGLLKNGEIDIYARWQKGHYNHESIHTVRFRLKDRNETITPWYKIPLGNAPGKRVMTLVVKDGIIATKNMG